FFFFCHLILFINQSFYKIHRKPTTHNIRQKQLSPQNKPKQTKAHQGGNKTETRLPHVFNRFRAKTRVTQRLHLLHQIGNHRRTKHGNHRNLPGTVSQPQTPPD
ncbi:unnamed protein product, partial [Brassica napus]